MKNKEFGLQMLGTGSAFAKRYYNNNALLYGEGSYNLMIDCGATAPLSLHELDIPISSVSGILISHIHGDHVNGLEEIAFQSKYIFQKKLDLIGEEDLLLQLWEHSLRGGLEVATEGIQKLEDYFNIILLKKDEPKEIGPFKLELLKTLHIPQKPNYSVFINEDFFYSADCQFANGDFLYHAFKERDCKIALQDCQLHDFAPVHASLSQLLTLPPAAQDRIYLMHYGDNMNDFIGETGSMEFVEQHTLYHYRDGELRHGGIK
jgi:ribonuclease BN (tRNA processing enzyme)